MISVTISGESINDLAAQAKQLADALQGEPLQTVEPVSAQANVEEVRRDPWGYLPNGIGPPERRFSPVDNGTEWDEQAIDDWLMGCSSDGLIVVSVLALRKTIDPRKEYESLGWYGVQWAGTWNSPRKQAERVKNSRGLKSWPYGHTYYEPRRLWMHADIAARVLKILETFKHTH